MPTRFRSALAQDHQDWLDGAANSLLRAMEAEGGHYVDMQTLVRHNGVLVCLVYEVGDEAERLREPLDEATRQAIKTHREAGMSMGQIARTCGVARSTVQRQLGKDA